MPFEDFEILRKIGTGRYACAYKVRRLQDNTIYAMKKFNVGDNNSKELRNALTQVQLLASINHPHVVAYREVFYEEEIKALCIIMDYAEEGDLSKKIEQKIDDEKSFSEEQVWSIILQLAQGLNYLHSRQIIHRDIKPSNILLYANRVVKIADLNVATICNGLCKTQTGTLSYASPQIWRGVVYNQKADIWSLGCVVYEIMTLRRPFQNLANNTNMFKNVIKGQYQRIGSNYSINLKNVVGYLLQINPKLRPSAPHIIKMCSASEHANTSSRFLIPISMKMPTETFEKVELDNLPGSHYQQEEEEFTFKRSNTDVNAANPERIITRYPRSNSNQKIARNYPTISKVIQLPASNVRKLFRSKRFHESRGKKGYPLLKKDNPSLPYIEHSPPKTPVSCGKKKSNDLSSTKLLILKRIQKTVQK